jgi:hypothetical protein
MEQIGFDDFGLVHRMQKLIGAIRVGLSNRRGE